ncbi:hypothetical protein C2L80_07230 [Rubneribacter badeniensis]|uniref:4-hydroxyphenylacetate decarboxylase small subunit n=1 Tax=Rubneribacter badeniensis TaxID=2070688 RepID=A0A2K2U4U3_9ACTN|nr:4-hydroxyphenylacetate decarboxylase small subunit [Rubneribacter badeniensis]OUO92724.1 hypothetical protein B5F41_10030 [Gordonibacter sp. An232A]PNV65321.1 hypothetical protein C2L80_07230 [Rubneribacter badeniensis]
MTCQHIDCWNYQAIDVVKGICLKHGGMVDWAGESCPAFVRKPKCETCANFSNPDEDNIGTCTGLSDGSHWVLGSRPATTCEGYRE